MALAAGLLVTGAAILIDMANMPMDRGRFIQQVIGDVIPGLLATVVCLGIQLRQEEIHYRAAIDRAAIVSELNHHIRNAVFPLSLAVQKSGDQESIRVATDAVDRINLALKDATADALSRRVEYSEPEMANAGERST
ncbi:MAG TPA: hypothetical protein VN622_04675 [Clostridia bacterium]|nr:hypothetical protein [Clostridia bacterium]